MQRGDSPLCVGAVEHLVRRKLWRQISRMQPIPEDLDFNC